MMQKLISLLGPDRDQPEDQRDQKKRQFLHPDTAVRAAPEVKIDQA
jgi:hypothetical protein